VSGGDSGNGTVFKISPSGALTTLYSFCSQSNCSDGSTVIPGLVLGFDGNFYGATTLGGTSEACPGGCGTVFRITPNGALTTLLSFNGADGGHPEVPPIQASDGNFYGVVVQGGTSTACRTYGCGTVFKMTPDGAVTALHSFDLTDGAAPWVLVEGTDGNFYGTTTQGGANDNCSFSNLGGCGTVFEISAVGALTTLYSFCSQSACADGAQPFGLTQDANGVFYGVTAFGGTQNAACGSGCGTIFSLSVGLGPFVETEPTAGRVGEPIKILGTNLAGATSVTFNGTPAAFTVESSSYIETTVPAGATTGTVQVVTPSGALSSNVPFRVAP
jgi:uncharacterized repeat protein (TIGR03803 family)